MKAINKLKKESCKARFPYTLNVKKLVLGTLILTGIQTTTQAQDTLNTKPSWWFGAAGAANVNFYRGSTQQLTADFAPPIAFHNGTGVGLYVAPLIEYYKPESRWGVMLQVGYDSRRSKYDTQTTPCNCPADLETKLTYISIEPNLRFAPFKSNFYLYAGPRIALNYDKSFVYKLGKNPEYPDQTANADITGDLSDVNKTVISMQIGAGYDIPLTADAKRTQLVLSPFVSFHPYFGQDPRSIETWNITTLRAGAALKLGVGHKKHKEEAVVAVVPDKPKDPVVETVVVENTKTGFTVNSPKNIPAERLVVETFPLRNYVFFDLGSNEIPERYVKLNKNQVADFKEDQVQLFTPKNMSGRSERQMVVYYNVLNILGDRMVKNPSTKVKLVGSSESGSADGLILAQNTKKYLVDVFGIESSRIEVQGLDKPKNLSTHSGGTKELELLYQGERRVSIESASPELLMEFQSGPSAPLKPVQILTVQKAPADSYVTFTVGEQKEPFTSWTLEVKDDKGTVQTFGPYTEEKVSIPGKDILGTNAKGDYKVTMIGVTKKGKTVKSEADVSMVLWTPPVTEQAMRFSVIYEFNESNAVQMYDKYLTEVVVPKIPKDGKVIIHGHTDVIGDDTNNKKLSTARANDVKATMEKALKAQGRSDVTFEVIGFGEDANTAPFENKYPEERFYNRTVLIDIVPAKK